ncbi:hypothetical protein PJF56_14290 [Roseofilum sp. BLCC_M91]|uniref:HTH cro/C1-type domain-containing protein n=1 Tax=Roseofilum halophilum BLCC-M91 TaxID=3022259 RepID=A0ABT7BNA7_9CYAN|nr:hypothetical protein [Roseofilum halophilum]MDJ1180034.1 hypothetical protein [Roseofilum halophilum BLCC-M91]
MVTGRSLIASTAGVKRAKQALKRRHLTQKAIAYELAIASWSTVSKFFNSKPVDRGIFMEICHTLELDWQEVVEDFQSDSLTQWLEETEELEPQEAVSPLIRQAFTSKAVTLEALQQNTLRARAALNPYILPTIPRQTLIDKCLSQVNRGWEGNRGQVISILGPAGYGKSTILGTVFDELANLIHERQTGWLGLVRCDDFMESAESFATEILQLSTDSHSLEDIIRNPLLLALLCDLFAESETVPEDLTVSQLYGIYWDWKIARVRHSSQSATVGLAKEKLSLKLAQSLYHQSGDRLRDTIYQTSLDLSDREFEAYSALKSEGVLKDLGSGRISFFHQTFLEYAIARWLNSTAEGEEAKQELFQTLDTLAHSQSQYYIWAIFRQLLTLLPLAEFYQVNEFIDRTQLLPFRSLAFAAISRSDRESVSILVSLLQIALHQSYLFQETLLIAANSAPRTHTPVLWDMVVQLLPVVSQSLINKAIDVAADLFVHLPDSNGIHFAQVLQAFLNRNYGEAQDPHYALQQQYQVLGQWIGQYYRSLTELKTPRVNPGILRVLSDRYFQFGSRGRALIFQLHQLPGATLDTQEKLFQVALTQPPSESFLEKPPAQTLLGQMYQDFRQSNILGYPSWLNLLYASLPARWHEVTAAGVGMQAMSDTELLTTLIHQSLLPASEDNTSKELSRHRAIAIETVCKSPGASAVIAVLLAIPIEEIPRSRFSLACQLIRFCAQTTHSDDALAIAQWLTPAIAENPSDVLKTLDTLAFYIPETQDYIGAQWQAWLPQLPVKTVNQILNKPKFVPDSLEPFLLQLNNKQARGVLVKLYHRQALQDSEPALSALLSLSLDVSKEVSQRAIRALLDLIEHGYAIPHAPILAVLSQSPVVGVRQTAMMVLIERVNQQQATEAEQLEVFRATEQEQSPEVLQLLYKLAEAVFWYYGNTRQSIPRLPSVTIPEPFTQAFFALTQRIEQQQRPDLIDTVSKQAFLAFTRLVLISEGRWIPELCHGTRFFLRSSDISKKMDRLVLSGLLHKLAQHNPQFLGAIVREDCFSATGSMPVANQLALVAAIINEQGKYSPLLNEILDSEQFPDSVKSRILQARMQ